MTHYEVLGVLPDADMATIQKASASGQAAPRRRTGRPGARRAFEAPTGRVRVLRDPVARRYDRGVAAPERPSDLLRRARGRQMVETNFASAPKATHPGANTVSVVEVSEALLRDGGVVRVPMPHGAEDVQVPSSAPRFGTARDLGAPGRNGGAAGDHLVVLVARRVS